ncbi:MAG: hypothetical protein D6824_02315 [Planctomycetota bacterium]|nr:MAG: hypothetical protein D6824_02315 [Planctomycetota bacterium]
MLNLRGVATPTQGDYRIAALVLERAHTLSPANEAILRRLIEAWQAAGNEQRSLRFTRELLRLRPDDEVALLRIVSDSVAQLQSAEARIAACDRLVATEALPATVRSRLALDAALLAREQGDEQGFVDRLTRATQLDSTNKQAAALAATYFLERSEDPLGRVETLANLLLADPLDPASHRRLAHELLSHGAYAGAKRFLDRVEDLVAALDVSLTQEERQTQWISRVIAIWGAQGARAALQSIDEEEQTLRDRIARLRYQAQLRGENPDDAASPFQPSPAKEMVRLVIAAAVDDDEQARKALDRLAELSQQTLTEIDRRLQEIHQQNASDASSSVDNLRRSALLNQAQMLWLRVWSGRQLDMAQQAIATLAAASAAQHSGAVGQGDSKAGKDAFAITKEALQRDRGWLLTQQGEFEQAKALLAPLADRDELARLGLARLAERTGQKREALLGYARIALEQPGTLVGMYARARVEKLLGQRLAPTRQAASLDSYALALPRILDDMTKDPSVFLSLEATLPTRNIGPLDPLEVDIELGNASTIPLAIGDRGPVSDALLLSPRVVSGARRTFANALPEVARLRTKLRLEPRQSLRQRVWAGGGSTGSLIDLLASAPLSLGWGVEQGFTVQEGGKLRKGGLALRDSTSIATRGAVELSTASVEELAAALRNAQGEQLYEAMLAVASLLAQEQAGLEPRLEQQQRQQLAKAFAEALPLLPPKARAFAAVIVPAGRVLEEAKVLDEALRADDDPLVRSIVLLSRVKAADDPVVTASLSHPDSQVRTLAALVQLRLQGWRPADESAAADQ